MSQASKEDFLKFSTLPNDERWWRLEVDNDDLRWIQANLGHGLDCRKRFSLTSRTVALSGALYEGCPWTERIQLIEGESAPRVLISLGNPYNYRSAYAKAREKRDPYLSPHGFFRNLEAGYHKHALQFMQQFGPLFIKSSTRFRGDSWWLSLGDFWDRHARFVAVSQLWEDRFDPDKLRVHWASLGEQHERLDRAGAAPLGYIPAPNHKFIQLHGMPWHLKQNQSPFPKAKASFQERLVYSLVHSELILHTQDCVLTWTAKDTTDETYHATAFEPTRCFTSLWSAIWELFGLDTRQYGWRLCQLCGKLFYPKNRLSECCRTEHQSLWSKRLWARKHRTAMRNSRNLKKSG